MMDGRNDLPLPQFDAWMLNDFNMWQWFSKPKIGIEHQWIRNETISRVNQART